MLINLRNALMSGRRLPYDAEVEYLESTGTQYIDTDEKIYDDTAVTVTMYNDYSTESATYFFGSDSSTERFYFREYQGKASFSTGGWWQNTSISIVGTHTVAMTNNSITVDGVSSSRTGTSKTGAGKLQILRSGTYTMTASGVRIYSCQILQNGTLVFDAIPVRVGTVGYLYDRVSGKLFGNAGSGDFVLGPDVVPVEYIESHGTEYIDTGITPSAATECNIDLMFTGTATQQFGTGRASSSEWAVLLGYYQNKIAFWAGVNQATRLGTHTVNERVMCGFSIPNGTYWLGGNPTADTNLTAPTTNCQTFALFARKDATNSFSGFCTMCAYSADINGVEGARKFLPVRVGTDATSWEGAMMDVPTRRIYRNQGTGAFTYGDDLKYPIPSE